MLSLLKWEKGSVTGIQWVEIWGTLNNFQCIGHLPEKKNTAQKDNVLYLGKLEIINIVKSVCPIRLISWQKKQNFDPVYCYKSFHNGINLKNLLSSETWSGQMADCDLYSFSV